MADDGESLESWLNKATNPSNRQEDWEYIMGFCDQINKELEGPQISVRLLAHKIQSPQEWEAMQALTVLEACMKNCGQRFHNEVGKFRFLNELIKVVSPKYLGDKVSDKVKSKVIELLYSWTVSLPEEAKISEAYQMLKSQGIVSADPEIPPVVTLMASPTQRPKNPVFDDEKKSKRLSELLKSKKPEDLQEANRLIKNMVKEDEVRTRKATKQQSTLEAVNSSVKLLNEMLAHFSPEASSEGDKEIMKELYSDCDKLRQTIFQLATETEDNDSNLGDILQASDDLSLVLNSYKKIVKDQTINGENEDAQPTQKAGKQGTKQSESLIDLMGLDVQSPSPPKMQPPASSVSFPVDLLCGPVAADPQSQSPAAPSAALSLLDEELLSLGLNDPVEIQSDANHSKHFSCFQDQGVLSTAAPLSPTNSSTTTAALNFPGHVFLTPPEFLPTTSIRFSQPHSPVHAVPPQSPNMAFPAPSAAPVILQQAASSLRAPDSSSAVVSYGVPDLALLDLGSPKKTPGVMDFGSLLGTSGDLHISPPLSSSVSTTTSTSLLAGDIQGSSPPLLANSQADDILLLRSVSPLLPLSQPSPGQGQEMSLANVFVPLEAIKPSKVCPVTAYDKNGVRVLLHFASDCPPGRPDVLVIVMSMLNTAPQPVKSIVLQAAVPKTMKVRLQPPTGTELAPFNPILPPAAITQVMLLANPLKEKVRMRYKLTFTLGEQSLTEVGEVNEFPPPERWGAL